LDSVFIKIKYLNSGTKSKVRLTLEQIASDTFENILESMNKNIAGVLIDDNPFSLDEIK
jgi:hypothetical protein